VYFLVHVALLLWLTLKAERVNYRVVLSEKIAIMPKNVRWCLENKENLNFTLTQFAYNRRLRILKKYVKDENLETNFTLWKNSDSVDDYWINKAHRSTI
jgi:hypothetical protein